MFFFSPGTGLFFSKLCVYLLLDIVVLGVLGHHGVDAQLLSFLFLVVEDLFLGQSMLLFMALIDTVVSVWRVCCDKIREIVLHGIAARCMEPRPVLPFEDIGLDGEIAGGHFSIKLLMCLCVSV